MLACACRVPCVGVCPVPAARGVWYLRVVCELLLEACHLLPLRRQVPPQHRIVLFQRCQLCPQPLYLNPQPPLHQDDMCRTSLYNLHAYLSLC